ncbi:MAG: amidohydrolase family protein [Pseudomonadota bacterium]
MRRREFLLGSLALSSLKASGTANAQSLPISRHLPARVIDAHCHIFNADDVPIEGFMKRVVIPGNAELSGYFKDYPDAFVVMIHALSRLLKDDAYSTATEIGFLNRGGSAPSAAANSAREISVIKILLDQIWDKSALRQLRWKKDAVAADLALRQLQRLMLLEVYSDFYCCGATQQDVDSISRQDVAERIYRSNQTIGRNLRWALLFMRHRFELADELHRMHRERTVLVTPALVDFSKWVEDEAHTPLHEQVDVMERISRRGGPTRGAAAVHGFVAFDPLRQALHEKGSERGIAPLELVKLAIEKKGFIGVKLYPPMGFRPANNAALGRAFPAHVLSQLGPNTGRILDEKMRALFAWCHENNVPVMAHTANSNAAGKDYGQRANPVHWEPVLKEFPKLRVNLAHFGGFREVKQKRREEAWEWHIGKMWQKTPGAFLFADISYFSEILGQKAKRQQAMNDLKSLKDSFHESGDSIIYGTDWAMIGREKGIAPIDLNAHRPYPELVADYLSAASFSDEQIEKIMFRNSVRFLGLGADQRASGTRGRLERFYQSAGLDAAWMSAFD